MKIWAMFCALTALFAFSSWAAADGGLLGGRGGGNNSGGGSGGGVGSGGGGGSVTPPPPPRRTNQGGSSRGDLGPIPPRRTSDPFGNSQRGGITVRPPVAPRSRSGIVRYGTNHRITPSGDVIRQTGGSWIIPSPGVSVIERQARQQNVRRANDPFRSGYFRWDDRFYDDQFFYPHYRFDFGPGVYVSPFYRYHHLPPYISNQRVILRQDPFVWPSRTTQYRYQAPRENADLRTTSVLDFAILNLSRAFERASIGEVNNLITQGPVWIDVEGEASYTTSSDDFYDLFNDLLTGTETLGWAVRDVRVLEDDPRVYVIAEHEFRSAFGRRDSQWHTFELTPDRNSYRISGLRIDSMRPQVR